MVPDTIGVGPGVSQSFCGPAGGQKRTQMVSNAWPAVGCQGLQAAGMWFLNVCCLPPGMWN